jgi:hypothetical protein
MTNRALRTFILFAAIATLAHCSSAAKSVAPGVAPDGGSGVMESGDGATNAIDGGVGQSTDAGPDAEAATPVDASHAGQVPMFVAQGYFGRTIVSCDDGHTWVGNHSWDIDDDGLWCGPKGAANCSDPTCSFLVNGKCDQTPCCNDTPDFSMGIVFGQNAFVGNWGHGLPGVIRRSTNGIDWTTTETVTYFGDIAYGGGRFVASSLKPIWSADGITWMDGGAADFESADGGKPDVVRRIGYGDYDGGGRFVALADPPGPAYLVSSDGAQTWWEPSVPPDACALGTNYGGILSGNGVMVILDQYGNACRSTDGAQTWSVSPIGVSVVQSKAVWTGSQFVVWGRDTAPGSAGNAVYMVTSPDGATWTKTTMATPVELGPVAVAASGTFVSINSIFDGYDKQFFLRSSDGLTWEQLPTTSFLQSHPLYDVTFGYADPSTLCPAPP